MSNRKCKKSPRVLVDETLPKPKLTWYDKLSIDHHAYVVNVVVAMRECPDAAPYRVAEALKSELLLVTHKNTIARTLNEMLKAGTE